MTDLDWELRAPTPRDVRFLEERLYEFNSRVTGIEDGRLLGIFVRDSQGRMVAGANGHTWGGTCEILNVWVDEGLRGEGVGRELLARAEAEARSRGCAQIVLTTHSFQAPDFYAKIGFEPIGEVPEYPAGHSEILLRKQLEPAPGADASDREHR